MPLKSRKTLIWPATVPILAMLMLLIIGYGIAGYGTNRYRLFHVVAAVLVLWQAFTWEEIISSVG